MNELLGYYFLVLHMKYQILLSDGMHQNCCLEELSTRLHIYHHRLGRRYPSDSSQNIYTKADTGGLWLCRWRKGKTERPA